MCSYVLFGIQVLLLIGITVQSTCYNSRGKRICDESKCPSNLPCRGNVAKDNCGCCDVCLKQENEICGGQRNQYGRCDHHANLCETVDSTGITRCITLAKALELRKVQYIKQLRDCKTPHWKKPLGPDESFRRLDCLLNHVGLTYFCRREPKYRLNDCCIHNTRCNPHKKIYRQLHIPVMQSVFMQPTSKEMAIRKSTRNNIQSEIVIMRKKLVSLMKRVS